MRKQKAGHQLQAKLLTITMHFGNIFIFLDKALYSKNETKTHNQNQITLD